MNRFTVYSCLRQSISGSEVKEILEPLFSMLISRMNFAVSSFVNGVVSPLAMMEFELGLTEMAREFLCAILQAVLNRLEIDEVERMPGVVHHANTNYRRLAEKTPVKNILSTFGTIELTRATYRQGSSGKTIAPLEKALGIEQAATPAALNMVGREMAATGASQKRAIESIAERTGARIGVPKLRKMTAHLAEQMSPFREQFQLELLRTLTDQALKEGKKNNNKPVLSISRDGVSICIAPLGYYEVAAVATVSVHLAGKCLGTVYLACSPEENQVQLSEQLTSLVTGIVRTHGEKFAKITYVSDAGQVETAYWKKVLSRLRVDGLPIKIERTVDYYHASLRLTTIGESLRLTQAERTAWLDRVRTLLKEPGGWGRVMRSISEMTKQYRVKAGKKSDYNKAVNYLRKQRRYMNYAARLSEGCPIGSGIVESACKQIVTERMKLSGMRWKHSGMQRVMTLRSILLSRTWHPTFKQMLINKHAVSHLYQTAA
jgi:hypothetical protein